MKPLAVGARVTILDADIHGYWSDFAGQSGTVVGVGNGIRCVAIDNVYTASGNSERWYYHKHLAPEVSEAPELFWIWRMIHGQTA